ncbi:Uncharacterised protein [Mycobacteroides abscessus subsp. abscessus]|nr:Uncharacterised protein [Mycobacteroides abscessus subsp. abscessus]SII85804.1 Uncharacterised protein [Mycobacteroides abscessus subsp. abscessus]SIL58818.1 Uncharacterised protein [Mycobacteroides abscessus subsp. abscessus]
MAQGVDLEIVDKGGTGDGVWPNCVRINGVEVLCPAGEHVTIHPVSDEGVVVATVTMFVRRLMIATE